MYIHNTLVSVHLDIPINNLGVCLPDYNIHILTAYRPPSSLPFDDAILLSYLNDFAPGKELIIMDDFNLSSIQWAGETPIVSNAQNQSFLDCFTSLGLLQWITEPTNICSDNTLDLVFTSDYDIIVDIQLCAPLPNCDHLPVIFSYLFEVNVPTTNSKKNFLWHKGNYTALNHALLEVDFDYEFSDRSVNEAYDRFVEIIHHMVPLYIPKRKSTSNSTSLLPWQTKPPRDLLSRRHNAWTHYKSLRRSHGRNSPESREALSTYLDLNYQYRNFAYESQKLYEASLMNNFKTKPKLFYSYIRNNKVGRPTIGPLKRTTGEVCSSARDYG